MMTFVRKSFRTGLAALAACAMLTSTPIGQARDVTGDFVKIEQDWEVVVGDPDVSLCSPQLFVLLWPASGGDFWNEFLINYNDQPTFSAGGVQIQVWQGNTVLDGHDNSPNQAVLQLQGEVVTFTLSMRVTSTGDLHYRAKNVSSTSFGNIGNLVASVPYNQPNLNSYSTDDTVNNSGILFGANRVTSMTLKQVRKYNAAGAYVTEDARQVFP
jgi:hypothetical protein